MKSYKVIMRVEIERCVDAESEEEAIDKVDTDDMMHELKNYGVDTEFVAEELKTLTDKG